jgi:group I intron endonuclease
MGCVYLARNKINGKCYVGKTTLRLKHRKRKHEQSSKDGSGHYFHRALLKYGFDSFKWSILVKSSNDKKLIKYEIKYIKKLNTKRPNGYNLTDGGDGTAGREMEEWQIIALRKRKFSAETRAKMSRSAKRRIRLPLSEEHKRKIGLAHKGKTIAEWHKKAVSEAGKKRRGFKHSDESRRNMSLGQMGRVVTEETRRKIADAVRGMRHSEETKAKIGKASMGRSHPMSEEARAKISAANKGRKHTLETRRKWSEQRKGHICTEETRKKIGDAQRAWAKKKKANQQ